MEEAPDIDGAARYVRDIVGTNVKRLRTERGWSQQLLGERSSLGRPYIYKIESSSVNLTINTLVALATAFGIELDEIHALLMRQGHSQAEPTAVVPDGSVVPPREGDLAVELPAGTAFEAARLFAEHLGKPVTLIDPITRGVAGVARKIPRKRDTE